MNNFYGKSLADTVILDKFKYKGRGRPRNTDYSTMVQVQKKINGVMTIIYEKR